MPLRYLHQSHAMFLLRVKTMVNQHCLMMWLGGSLLCWCLYCDVGICIPSSHWMWYLDLFTGDCCNPLLGTFSFCGICSLTIKTGCIWGSLVERCPVQWVGCSSGTGTFSVNFIFVAGWVGMPVVVALGLFAWDFLLCLTMHPGTSFCIWFNMNCVFVRSHSLYHVM